ncbi:unnamed protein product [Brassica oleracea var. botrytis]|uniref:Uncharacterized protein n=3 Tax=Brassica TaxID=3705 RepID=A0A0D3E939_BRAOL|nr:unnamed protein product [Brassica napus]CDY40859.1 BnaC09g26060D [Brassica napus]VDD31088.1 unnamed protein product [Brassica oleracea]
MTMDESSDYQKRSHPCMVSRPLLITAAPVDWRLCFLLKHVLQETKVKSLWRELKPGLLVKLCHRVSEMVAQEVNLNGRSSRSTQDENIYEKLKKAAQDGHIERLYKLIAEDQNI